MADRTDIPLTEATWNPVTGCSPISPGCRRCYAQRFARRLAGRYGYPADDPFAVTVHRDRLGQPERWKKPRHVFVCSMGDLFHADVPEDARRRVFQIMADVDRHTYLVLTKRAREMAAWLGGEGREFVQPMAGHVWMGVSVESQACAGARVPSLLESWPGLRVVCAEPLQDALDISPWLHAIDWVICGGETGSGGMAASPEHVRGLRDQCVSAGTAFYFKAWGGRNSRKAGNLLDGRAWEEMPACAAYQG